MGINDSVNRAKKKQRKLFQRKKKEKVEVSKPTQTADLKLNQVTQDFRLAYNEDWENKTFLSTVELSDVKAILYNIRNQPIALANGYSSYLQILEIYGNDIASLSEEERVQVIASYTQWLAGTNFDLTLQTTTLPTNTRMMIEDLLRVLREVKYQLLDPNLSDIKRYQLNQRQDILVQNIIKEEIVAAQQYNTEFFVWIFADTLEELENYTRIAQEVSYSFVPHFISTQKKEQILKQYYNYNEGV